jgi:isocitrate/isopropylmalate dehydrogenase
MILAAGAVLSYIDDARARSASHAIYDAAIGALNDGIATADLGGTATTTEFTDAVIARIGR